MQVFMTGGSGFLGRALLARLVRDPRYHQIDVLLRADDAEAANARLDDLVKRTFSPAEAGTARGRLTAVPGDLARAGLGLDAATRARLVAETDRILHVGASTDFGAPLDLSRRDNVEGTRLVLDLAEHARERGRLARVDYVSTAFVAGDTAGVVTESDLDRGQTFANTYEQTKFESERLVRAWRAAPVTIHRPSIVVGDSRHGFTPHFKVLYWPLRLLSRGLLPFVPGGFGARLDVVPVDFVADGIAALFGDPAAAGQTFHLTAGRGSEVTVGQVLRDAARFAGITRRPRIPYGALRWLRDTPARRIFGDEVWATMELGAPYASYLKGGGPRFDAAMTHARLEAYGIVAPKWGDYREQILGFCRDSRWGRRLERPEYSYYQLVTA
jgi:thioester reductase-like protein